MNWCFTWHNYPEDWKTQLVDLDKLAGFCVGMEKCPTTDRDHLQGWIQFKKKGQAILTGTPKADLVEELQGLARAELRLLHQGRAGYSTRHLPEAQALHSGAT